MNEDYASEEEEVIDLDENPQRKRSWLRWGAVALTVILVLVASFIVWRLVQIGTFASIPPSEQPNWTLIPLPGPAEDLAYFPERGLVFMSMRDANDGPGSIGILNPNTLTWSQLTGTPTEDFQPLGIDLYHDTDSGQTTLFVVNQRIGHPPSVELFSIEPGPSLKQLQSVATPELTLPNDVAAIDTDSFFVTNNLPRESLRRRIGFFIGLSTGEVLRFDDGAITKKSPGLGYPNGILYDRAADTLFVAETASGVISQFANASYGFGNRRKQSVGAGVDNLSYSEDGRLWYTRHLNLIAAGQHLEDPDADSPWSIHTQSTGPGSTRASDHAPLLTHAGDFFSGASVTLPVGNQIFVGGVAENALLVLTERDLRLPE